MTKEEAIEFGKMWLEVNADSKGAMTYEVFEIALKALDQQPCEDAISRKEVKDIIRKIYVEEFTYVSDKDIETLLREIDKLPPVTPIRPKGEWETGYTYPDGEYWKCSECGELIKVKFPMNFCNSCGADMRGEKDAT